MGAKADFYIKRDDTLEWQGSIEWNAEIHNIPTELIQATCEYDFLLHLQKLPVKRQRWPWFWPTSKNTDYSYILHEAKGGVFISCFGGKTFTIYQYRQFQQKNKLAKQSNLPISSLSDFIEKYGHFIPNFPLMKSTIV